MIVSFISVLVPDLNVYISGIAPYLSRGEEKWISVVAPDLWRGEEKGIFVMPVDIKRGK